jgi:hypothetical protein
VFGWWWVTTKHGVPAVAPASVTLGVVERPAAHHDRADAVDRRPQDLPVLVGGRVEHPVVQHLRAVAERVPRLSFGP